MDQIEAAKYIKRIFLAVAPNGNVCDLDVPIGALLRNPDAFLDLALNNEGGDGYLSIGQGFDTNDTVNLLILVFLVLGITNQTFALIRGAFFAKIQAKIASEFDFRSLSRDQQVALIVKVFAERRGVPENKELRELASRIAEISR